MHFFQGEGEGEGGEGIDSSHTVKCCCRVS